MAAHPQARPKQASQSIILFSPSRHFPHQLIKVSQLVLLPGLGGGLCISEYRPHRPGIEFPGPIGAFIEASTATLLQIPKELKQPQCRRHPEVWRHVAHARGQSASLASSPPQLSSSIAPAQPSRHYRCFQRFGRRHRLTGSPASSDSSVSEAGQLHRCMSGLGRPPAVPSPLAR